MDVQPGVIPQPTDGELAAFAAGAYGALATVVSGDVHAVLTTDGPYVVVAFRGTVPTSWADWWRDFSAWPHLSRDHPQLGYCHAGFLSGAEALWPSLRGLIAGKPAILTGHSLGGALAVCTAGLMAAEGTPPAALVTFGAPRAGGDRLVGLLQPVPVRQYRDGNDPVPDVPLLYQHVRLPLISIGTPDLFDPIACHAITRYGLLLTPEPAAPALPTP